MELAQGMGRSVTIAASSRINGLIALTGFTVEPLVESVERQGNP
jgi:hypothetical protein